VKAGEPFQWWWNNDLAVEGAGGSASTFPAVRRNPGPGRIGLGPCHVTAKIKTVTGLLGSGLILIYRASMCCSRGR
jgi:hypothetical protein